MSERGGYLGELGYWATSSTVGDIGTGIVVAAGLIAAVILISGASLGHLVRRGGQGAAVASRTVSKGVATATVTAIRSSQSLRERLDAIGPPTLSGRRRPPPAPRPLLDGADTFPDIFSDPSALPPSPALGPAGGGEPLEADPGAAAAPAAPAAPGAGGRRGGGRAGLHAAAPLPRPRRRLPRPEGDPPAPLERPDRAARGAGGAHQPHPRRRRSATSGSRPRSPTR